MGRRAEGWSVRWKRGWAYVCFTHASTEHRIALGTRDAGEAARLAPNEYAAVVSGRRTARAERPSALLGLEDMMAEYLASLEGSHDPSTIKTDVIHGRRFVAHFVSLDRITEASIGDYSRARLRQVLKTTVKHERSFLSGFLRWCVEQGAMARVPPFPDLPRKATGTRAGAQRATPVHITEEEALAIIAELPVLSKTIGGRRWPLRARFAVAWETGLRPETLARLAVPAHFTAGAKELVLDASDDKARFARRVPLSAGAQRELDAVAPGEGLIFGAHTFAKALKKAARTVLGEERARQFAQYDFRHGRATQLAEETGNLPGVAYLMGHAKLSTTDKYLRGTQRSAERVLAQVGGTFTGPGGKGEAKPVKFEGDRRVSNPRQLDPQRSILARNLRKTAGAKGHAGSQRDPKSHDSRTGSGLAAAGGLALQLVTWDLFEAFAADAEDES